MQDLLRQALSIARGMWRFRWSAVAVAWGVTIVGAVVVWRIPDQFEASARIQVDTDSILKPLMSGLAVQPNVEQQVAMLSRTLISRPNMEKLVRMADLDLGARSKAEQEALVDRLQKDVAIRAAGGTNLYTMTFRDAEPEKAKRVVQALVSIFVESGLGSSRKDTDSAKAFLDEQIKVFEGKLEAAEARLKDFRLRNLDQQGPDGKDAATRLGEINAQLETARLQLREAERARDAARRQLAEAKGQVPSTALPDLLRGSTSGTGHIAVSTPEIDARIDAQKRNLDGLLQRFTEQHPDVVSTKKLIADLEAQKRREVEELQRRAAAAAAAAPPTSNRNEDLVIQEIGRMIATAEVQVAAMQARVDEYSGRAAQVRQQLRTAPQLEAEAAQLNRDYEITKKNYQDLVARRQAALLSGELEVASGVADFRLIDPPRASPKPVFPNRLALFPLALLAGLAAGLALAFGLSQLRPTFGDADEIRVKTGLPLLGVVTALVTDAERRRERAGIIRFAGASGALVGLFAFGMVMLVVMNRAGV